jgi:large subunit ribosomal protein L24
MSVPSPRSPRRQRRALYTASTFERRVRMAVPLSRELRRRFRRRSVPLRKGDTVRVMSGSFVGREERVAKIDRRGYSVTLDNVTLKTGEAKLKPLPIRTSHLVLTKLNLADAWRRRSLQVREEDVTPEERGETAELPEPEPGPEPVPEPLPEPEDEEPGDDEDEEDQADEEVEEADESEGSGGGGKAKAPAAKDAPADAPPPKPTSRRRKAAAPKEAGP